MKRFWFRPSLLILPAIVLGLTLAIPFGSVVLAQQPSETPTSAPETTSGMYITVITTEPYINVRMGPGSIAYPTIVGTLLQGQTAPALGKSPGGDWIQIQFDSAPNGKGWVYSPLVAVSPGALRIVEPPPTPLPPATATIDATLAAQFNIVPTSTRLPTFTPAPEMTVPIYTEKTPIVSKLPISIASIIVFFGAAGLLGFMLSLLRRR
ncbi:MAG: hypothetical protein MUO77_03155 [Anaerolineales bacterium]|nr:hypothetical protein [Anaerolineales bacterium]